MAGNFEGNPRTGHIIVRPEEYARVNYKIVLKDKRGRLCTARFAHTYEIFYGRKKIFPSAEIPRGRRSAADKKLFLLKKIKVFENKRLAAIRSILHKRKLEAQKRKRIKEQKKRKSQDTNLKKVVRDSVIKDYEKAKPEIDKQYLLLADEELDFKNVTEEAPVVLANATVGDVIVVPFKPTTTEYRKRLVDKIITTNMGTEYLYLTILDFDFKKNFIQMGAENFREATNQAISRMFPHAEQFFKGIIKTADEFVLRIKFMQNLNNAWVEHGVSMLRQEIASLQELAVIFKSTFVKLQGIDYIKKERLHTQNYLQGEKIIFITGFSLEATEW